MTAPIIQVVAKYVLSVFALGFNLTKACMAGHENN
jgi:hypothetical protein